MEPISANLPAVCPSCLSKSCPVPDPFSTKPSLNSSAPRELLLHPGHLRTEAESTTLCGPSTWWGWGRPSVNMQPAPVQGLMESQRCKRIVRVTETNSPAAGRIPTQPGSHTPMNAACSLPSLQEKLSLRESASSH